MRQAAMRRRVLGHGRIAASAVPAVLAAVLAACGGGPSAPERVRAFSAADRPIAETGVAPADGGWRIEPAAAGSVRLFEVPGETCERCRLIYRATMRSTDLARPAYLEMWVRAPGRGEFFSRGLHQPVRGTTGWAEYEIPFVFQAGERADLVKLNLAFEGPGGSLTIKDVELLRAPLP